MNFARIRRFFAGDDTENRRLARAVAPDKSDFFLSVDLKRNAAQNLSAAV
jgi:hypothetical protein